MRATPPVITILLAGLLLAACAGREPPPLPAPAAARPVVVQGAMDLEVKKLASELDNMTQETVQGWTFWSGTLDGYPVVVSKTLKGVSNAAAASRPSSAAKRRIVRAFGSWPALPSERIKSSGFQSAMLLPWPPAR